MSPGAVKWAYDQHAGKNKFCLVTLAMFADGFGVARIEVGDLAELLGASRATVFRALADLEADQFIKRHNHKAKNGTQLVTVTKLCMGQAYVEQPKHERQPSADADIPQGRKMRPGPSLNLRPGNDETPTDTRVTPGLNLRPGTTETRTAGSQFATHKEKDILISIPIPAAASRVPDAAAGGELQPTAPRTPLQRRAQHRAALQLFAKVGLSDTWSAWVEHVGAAQTTQEAQSPHWVAWIEAGLADSLVAGVEKVRYLGAEITSAPRFLHGFMQKEATDRAARQNAPTSRDGSAAAVPTSSARFVPGARVRWPDGEEATITKTAAACIYTDHADRDRVPLALLKTLEVVA